jgi:long-chain acyl-CoA synthetase
MLEMYALTETAGAIAVTPADGARAGTTGRAVPHAEFRLSEAGEILVRGDMVFLGYLGDAEATASVLHDGWLHTGDAGTIDPDGFVTIRGRMTDIFETADGRTVEPAATENALKLSPYVSDAVVVGAGRDALACLVALDHDNAIKYAQENGVAFTHFQSLCRAPEMRTLIAGEIARATSTLPQAGRIRGFRIIDRPLSVEAGELTPMLGLNRRLVEERHAALVEEIYADAG